VESSTRSNRGQKHDDATKVDTLALHLEVRDPAVIEFLLPFDESERVAKASEALHVGVFVLQSGKFTVDLRGLP
jgi:hypothetical protein